MLKSLYPNADWDTARAVGFDLDGTLYDEFEFISQVYQPIAGLLANSCGRPSEAIYQWMVSRWLEKGSSYGHIFEEVLDDCGKSKADAAKIIEDCVRAFRNFRPEIALPGRVTHLLDQISRQYPVFLITDGQSKLQSAKIASLGLQKWVQPENIAISGDYGREFQKSSTRMNSKIAVLGNISNASAVIYFGDRKVDEEFAANSGFQFIKVHCMAQIP